jgi:hypothetical protein
MKMFSLAVPVLIAMLVPAVALKSCDGDNVPTSIAIQAQIPKSVLADCRVTRSPGGRASNRQSAQYLATVVSELNQCARKHHNSGILYNRYKDKLDQLNSAL